jgi:hypothetical protein
MNFYDYAYTSESQTTEEYCVAIAGINSQYNTSTSSWNSKAPRGKWYHVPCTETREYVCYHDGSKYSMKYIFFANIQLLLLIFRFSTNCCETST